MTRYAVYVPLDPVIYALQVGAAGASPRPEVTLNFGLPPGVVWTCEPLLQYRMRYTYNLAARDQIAIDVEINGTPVHREWFFEGDHNLFVQEFIRVGAPADPRQPRGLPSAYAPFKLNAVNEIRFRPVNESSHPSPNHIVSFSHAVLWFQAESTGP